MATSKKHLPSLSKSTLLTKCQAWAIDSSKEYEKSLAAGDDLTAMNDGNTFHDAIDAYIKTGVVPYVEKEPIRKMLDHAVVLVGVYREAGWTIQSEVCFGISLPDAFDDTMAEIVTLPGARQYPYEASVTYGTADMVLTKTNGAGVVTELLVADWKTGGTESAEGQLKSLGFAASLVYPGAQLTLQALKPTEETVWVIPYEVGNLKAHWVAMRAAYRTVSQQKYKPYPGIHCTQLYCPHLAFCGAFEASEAQASSTEAEGYTKLTDSPVSNSEAGRVMATLSAIKRRTKYYENALKRYVDGGGQVIAGDYVWSKGNDGFRWRKNK